MHLQVGTSEFKEARLEQALVLDKSLFIEEVINDDKTICILRPRRFSKTFNMSMLNYFFTIEDAEENRALFKGMNIEKAKDSRGRLYMDYQGKSPTIFITFKELQASNYEEFLSKFSILLAKTFKRHAYLLTSQHITEHERDQFQSLLDEKAEINHLQNSLLQLTEWLSKHHGEPVVVLIDEYDMPFHYAFISEAGDFSKAVSQFMRIFLGRCVKG